MPTKQRKFKVGQKVVFYPIFGAFHIAEGIITQLNVSEIYKGRKTGNKLIAINWTEKNKIYYVGIDDIISTQ